MAKKLINLHKNNLDRESKDDFPGQYKNEKVVLVIRKHWIVLLPYFLHIALMCLLPVIFYSVIVPYVLPAFLEEPYDRFFILLVIIYYGLVWTVIFTVWLDYYLDIWIITNRRIIDVEQVGFFNRVVSELDLTRIQDITSSVHGMISTMFAFGSIHVQTAAEERKIDLERVPHPVTVRRQIIKLYKAAKEKNKFILKDNE